MELEEATELIAALTHAGVVRGTVVALVLSPSAAAFAVGAHSWSITGDAAHVVQVVLDIENRLRPRWLWWSAADVSQFASDGIPLATCWDLAAVHRIIFGGWHADPARVWAKLNDLSTDTIPAMGQLDLLDVPTNAGGDTNDPVQPDGHLRPEWTAGTWQDSPLRTEQWAKLATRAYELQLVRLHALTNPTAAITTARSESLAELLCTELTRDGLPIDVPCAERILHDAVGARPNSAAEEDSFRATRDAAVLKFVPGGGFRDLRNPMQLRELLRSVGIDVPNTRAGSLEPFRHISPLVEALLLWRKTERLFTTYGYRWLDENVQSGRLRGSWTGCDGAAGRMTASAGLHNLPAELRDAVAAEPGFVFVHADLGQIEPRVLAAVSGDEAFISAAQQDDLYTPIAERLRVDRAAAKLAVLGAMYGATSGAAGEALRGLRRAYPTAMAFLDEADHRGRNGISMRTYGGRLVRMNPAVADSPNPVERSAAAAQGRYARNAVIQGAAAELFKAWAVTLRGRVAPFDARIVLCLHDELLIHTPVAHASAVCELVERALPDAAQRWMPGGQVRYVAKARAITRWSEAK